MAEPSSAGARPRCARCHEPELRAPESSGGGPLSSWTCARCGGGFIPEDGASRLFEELGHTTGDLRELAAHYGGARLACLGCRSKMSLLQLRGASLDVCFGCGALWVDAGDLELVSSGRYQMPPPSVPLAKATAAMVPAQSLVRIDERSLPRHVGRAVLAGVGAVGLVWCLVGILPLSSGLAALAALAAAGGLSRRRAFDVLPRARRMMRWRGYIAPGPADDVGEAFSPDACVVVRRLRLRERLLPWVVLDLVDAEGRDLVRLHGPMSPQRAWIEGPRYARALGVTVRFDVDADADDALDAVNDDGAERGALLAFAANVNWWRLAPERTAGAAAEASMRALRHLVVKGGDGAQLGVVSTAVPQAQTHRRGLDSETAPAHLDVILAEHFVLEDTATGNKARLHAARLLGERATIIVGPSGEVLGHVAATRSVLADVVTWTGPKGRRRLSARLAHGARAARIVDGFGRDVGMVDAEAATPGEPRPISVLLQPGRAAGDARWGLLALAVHLSFASVVDDL